MTHLQPTVKNAEKASVGSGFVASTTEAALWSRLLRPDRPDLSAAAARSILRIGFDDADKARMHELAAKGQDDELSDAERAEVDTYRRVGRLLDLMHSKARRSLQKPKVAKADCFA